MIGYRMNLHYLFIFIGVFRLSSTSDPIVEIEQGKLQGKAVNHETLTYYSFLNIPYGTPPVGDLRFEASRPANGWNNVRDATEDLKPCCQITHSKMMTGEEDCLHLNVYTPKIGLNDEELLPVMVFLHGGAFVEGSASSEMFKPDNFMTENVILVVINYRLGLLGFLNSEDVEINIPGNAGLKDQVLALEWVKNNIKQFGGNPDSVTIFGVCAGSVSTHMHLLSEQSKGLFHKAIAESGTAANPWGQGPYNTAEILAKVLEITEIKPGNIAKALKEAPINSIMKGQQELIPQMTHYNDLPSGPVQETYVTEKTFLKAENLMAKNISSDVPFMLGYTSAEAIIAHGTSEILDLKQLLPKKLKLLDENKQNEIVMEIKSFYFNGNEPNMDNLEDYLKFLSDAWFMYDIQKTAFEIVTKMKNPIYFYKFTMDTKMNMIKNLIPQLSKYSGASHADDLGYLFGNISNFNENDVEFIDVKRMIKLWTNFAKTGNPNEINDSKLIDVEWKPLKSEEHNYLELGNTFSTGINPDKERYDFWNNLYKKYA